MKKIRAIIIISSLLLLTSCSTLINQKTGTHSISSSLTDFLYSDKNDRVALKTETPELNLPVRVGVAFVPTKTQGAHKLTHFSEVELLNKVKQTFSKYPYIESIEIIPSVYLKGGEGFKTIKQISRLYAIDVMALLSYDQVSQSYENKAAFLYWTIVGMYLTPGNENSMQTFVDTSVFDVKTEKLLFRAPGINKVNHSSVAIEINQTLSEQSQESFQLAVADMTTNLESELKSFKSRVVKTKSVIIKHKEGYNGGGSFGFYLLLIALLAGIMSRRNQTCKGKYH